MGLGGLGHMGAEARRGAGRRGHAVHAVRRARKQDAAVWAPTRSCSRPTPTQMAAVSWPVRPDHRHRADVHDLNPYLPTSGSTAPWSWSAISAPLDPMLNTVPDDPAARKSVAGSLIGGIAETQEMLDFCGQHGIASDVEVIPMQDINEAYERMLKSDVNYRFVIDMASLKARAHSEQKEPNMDIKRAAPSPPARGRRTGSPARCGSIRCSPRPTPARVGGASVTFEPGARTAWHTHPLGQTLIVTAGCGRVAALGRPDRGDPARRRGLVPAGRKALARRHADHRHDPYRHPGKLDGKLDGKVGRTCFGLQNGQRPAVRQPDLAR